MITLIVLIAIIVIWNIIPHLIIWTRPNVSFNDKLGATVDMIRAWGRGMLVIVPDLISPILMFFVLWFIPREAEHLPKIFEWWDNDVSINGDQAEGEETYYAPGHDRRGFWARYVWLGWRNRASRLSQILGHTWQPGEYDDCESWGDPATGRNHEGWVLNRRGPRWQIYLVKRVTDGLCFRHNYGFKVWSGYGDQRAITNVVNISASVVRWRGP